MKTVLLRKGSFTNQEVQNVWENIEDYVSRSEAEEAIGKAVEEVQEVLEIVKMPTSFCWSGGKDSLALETVVNAAGLSGGAGVCGVAADIEVPSALSWYRAHRPEGVVEFNKDEYDFDWLAANPQFIFPTGGKEVQIFTNTVTRWSQHKFLTENGRHLMLLGRRRSDGNWFPATPYNIHDSAGGLWFSPIRSWTHELTLAVIHYAGMTIPPVYSWSRGWQTGTGPWPGWRMNDGWDYLAEVDPDLATRAQTYLKDRLSIRMENSA